MKQHEAIGLALESELKTTTKLVLVTLIYKLDWETWEKPMSVSYIFKALGGQVSKSTISRALGDLQKLGVIRRYDTADRADGVRLIKLNTERLSTLCQPDIPPMSERHTPSVSLTDNIISNNLIDNQNDNQSKQNPSLETRENPYGWKLPTPRPTRETQPPQPKKFERYEDIVARYNGGRR